MNTTSLRFGTRTIVIFSLLALPAGSLACVATAGTPDEGADPSASPADPDDKLAATTADTDSAPPIEQPTGELDDPSTASPAPPAGYRGPRQK